MTLEQLIEKLSKIPAETVVEHGFDSPHSYRGVYEYLAFEPTRNVTIGSMLECAKRALNETFTGYKGGEYIMSPLTNVYLAAYGNVGEPIRHKHIRYWEKCTEHKLVRKSDNDDWVTDRQPTMADADCVGHVTISRNGLVWNTPISNVLSGEPWQTPKYPKPYIKPNMVWAWVRNGDLASAINSCTPDSRFFTLNGVREATPISSCITDDELDLIIKTRNEKA